MIKEQIEKELDEAKVAQEAVFKMIKDSLDHDISEQVEKMKGAFNIGFILKLQIVRELQEANGLLADLKHLMG